MISLEQIIAFLRMWFISSGLKIVFGLIVLFIGWKAVNKIIKVVNKILKRRKVDLTIIPFLDGVMNISLKILLILMVMDYVGLKTSGFIALLGSAGLAVGLALQGSLSNFAGGVIILLIRPFGVGDMIDSGDYSGKVEKIGIFYTYLKSIDNKQILIPNGELTNRSLVNYTEKEMRRVDLIFSAGYEQDIKKVKDAIYSVINEEKLIIKEPEPFVGVSNLNASSVDYVVKVWTNTEDYWTVYYSLLENVKIKFDEENISIPFNQLDINIKK